jgi:hypothetical protein
VRFNGRALLVGKTETGKTTFARYLFHHFDGCRRVLVNVKGRVDVGVPKVADPGSIDWTAPLIDWVPPSFQRGVFEAFYEALWQHRGVPTVVWTDEGAAITSASYAPDGLVLVQQQGAEWDMGHIVCAQRCRNIKMELRTEADEFYIWPGLSQPDLDWLAAEISEVDGQQFAGWDLRRRLRELEETYPAAEGENCHAFLRWRRSGSVLEDCEPLDPGWVGAPLAQPRATSKQPGAAGEEAIEPEPESSPEAGGVS